jgi:hypothetical protein
VVSVAGTLGCVAGIVDSVVGALGLVAGTVVSVAGGGTTTEVVETTGGVVCLVGGAVG